MTTAIEIFLCLIFLGTTLAFGGVQPLTYSLAEIFLFLVFLIFLELQRRRGRISLSVPIWPVLFILWIGLQILPLPQGLAAAVSPARRLVSTWLGSLGPHGSWAALSIYPHETALGLIKFLAYLSAFVLAAQLFDSSRRKSYLIRALIILGCFEAGYGILQYLLGWYKIFTYPNPYDFWVATGTFINRNHFAGLIEMVLPFALASAFYSYQLWLDERRGRIPPRPGGKEASASFQAAFYLFLALIMVLGVIFSSSRAGILSIMISVFALAVLSVLKISSKTWGVWVLGFVILVVGFGIWVGLGPMLSRFEAMGQGNFLQASERSLIWKDTGNLLHDHPILGTGLGTFEQAFRPYQTALVNDTVDHAHSDYLEFASETGLLGAALLFIPIFYLLVRMTISFLDDRRRYRRAVTLGCIGSTLALLIHSAVDFNLQVPANALIFAVILGIGYKVSCLEPRKEVPRRANASV